MLRPERIGPVAGLLELESQLARGHHPVRRSAIAQAIERRALWMAEDAARELPNLPLEDALQLVHL